MTHPYELKIVEAITPQAGGAITGDYISLKNVQMAYIVVHVAQGHAAQMTISIEQAQNVAGLASKVITKVVPIWSNLDCVTSDTLVRRTDAVNYQLDAGLAHKVVVFQLDPATLDIAGGFDCAAVLTTASNALNITAAMYYLVPRYQPAGSLSVITN